MALLDITPIFISVVSIFSIILIMMKQWYYEDIGLFMLGLVFYHLGVYQDLRPLLYLGWTFLLIGIILAIINLIIGISVLFGKPITIDIFHKKGR